MATPSSEWHDCQHIECTTRIAPQYLMCVRHWRQVPIELRQRVYDAWNLGKGEGTPEHKAAILAAILSTKPEKE